MAMVWQGPKSRAHLLSESIGKSLGEGLGNFTGNYFANKKLESIMGDPQYKDKPLEEKWEAMQRGLASYGGFGEKALKRQMEVDQTGYKMKQERQQKATDKLRGSAFNKTLNNQPLTKQEEEALTPEDRLGIAKHEQALEIQKLKTSGKAAPGGVTAQPIPPEISQKISEVLKENPNANPDQLAAAFGGKGIPQIHSNPYVENRRQQFKPTFEPTEEKLEAERVSKIGEEIIKDYKGAQNEDMRLDRQEQLMKEGKLSTPLLAKAMDYIGLPLGVLNNPASEEFQKLETDYVRDVSSLFPGQIRVIEIETYLKTVPSLMNSPEGQAAVIRNRRLQNEGKKLRYNEYKKVLEENGGRKPRNMDLIIDERIGPKLTEIGERFKQGVDDALDKFGPKARMYDKEGNAFDIPTHLIKDAQSQGLIFK